MTPRTQLIRDLTDARDRWHPGALSDLCARALAEIEARPVVGEALVEAAARAACETYGNEWDETPESGVGLRSGHPLLPARQDWRDIARAVLSVVVPAVREEAAKIAEQFTVKPDRNIHPDIPWDQMNEAAQMVAHTTAQQIAAALRELGEAGGG